MLEHPGVVKDPNRIRDSWEAAYGGAANAHRVAVLEEGMAYKPISLPPEDSQFLETKQFSVTEICRIFRVPPHLVADLSRATFLPDDVSLIIAHNKKTNDNNFKILSITDVRFDRRYSEYLKKDGRHNMTLFTKRDVK